MHLSAPFTTAAVVNTDDCTVAGTTNTARRLSQTNARKLYAMVLVNMTYPLLTQEPHLGPLYEIIATLALYFEHLSYSPAFFFFFWSWNIVKRRPASKWCTNTM